MAKYLEIPILNDEYKVIVFFGSAKDAEKIALKWSHQPHRVSWDDNRGITYFTQGCHPVIAMPRKPKTPDEYGTLAHEACHAVEIIFNKIAQPVGDEVFAHSVGAVVRNALKWKK